MRRRNHEPPFKLENLTGLGNGFVWGCSGVFRGGDAVNIEERNARGQVAFAAIRERLAGITPSSQKKEAEKKVLQGQEWIDNFNRKMKLLEMSRENRYKQSV